MKFAAWTYRIAGIYGLLLVTPLLFAEASVAPGLTHPSNYYGFVIAVIAWQFVFLLISRDPLRYRPLMPITLIEKLYGLATVVLFQQGRADVTVLVTGLIDLLLGVCFLIAYLRTGAPRQAGDPP